MTTEATPFAGRKAAWRCGKVKAARKLVYWWRCRPGVLAIGTHPSLCSGSPTGRDMSPPQDPTPGNAPASCSWYKGVIEGYQSDLLDRKEAKPLSQSSPAKPPHIPAPVTGSDSELRQSGLSGTLGATCSSSSLDLPSGKVACGCSPRLGLWSAPPFFPMRDGGGSMLASGRRPK